MNEFGNKAANVPDKRLQEAFWGEAKVSLGKDSPQPPEDDILDAEIEEDDTEELYLFDICEKALDEAFEHGLQNEMFRLAPTADRLIETILAWEKDPARRIKREGS